MASGPNLQRRMLVTVLALLAGNVTFVVVLTILLGPWLKPVRTMFVASVPVDGVVGQLAWWGAVLVPMVILFLWAQLQYTRRQTLAEVDARLVSRAEYPDLHGRIDRLAQLASCRPPSIAAAPSSVPNSFAIGTVQSATIVVSEGLLETLSESERDAVLAHELAHIRNHDATVMTLASFLPALTNGEYRPLADLLGSWGRVLVLALGSVLVGTLLSTTLVEGSAGSGTHIGGVVVLAGATYLLAGVVLGVLTAPVAYLGRSLSRYREFAADEAAAQFTGEPAALASALQRLDDDASNRPAVDKRAAYEGVRGLCFLPHGFGTDTDRSKFYVETRSHPPTDERIDRLQSVTGPPSDGTA